MYRIYCLRDVKAVDEENKGFLRPFISVHDGEAMRGIVANLRDPQSHIAQFPHDFELYRIAEFNEATGDVRLFGPEFLCTVVSLVEAPPPGAGPDKKTPKSRK